MPDAAFHLPIWFDHGATFAFPAAWPRRSSPMRATSSSSSSRTIVGALFGSHVKRFRRVIALIDALGLGAYAAFGTQKALQFGLAVPAAILVGVINAAGGGLLRDVLTREEPLVFRPGQFYVLTAVAGAVTFVFLSVNLSFTATSSAFVAIAVTFIFRVLTIVLNWRTSPIAPPEEPDLTP